MSRFAVWALLAAVLPGIPESSGAQKSVPPAPLEVGDCNDNGVPDTQDISEGTSLDCNDNGVPDECDTAVRFTTHTINTQADGAQAAIAADIDGDGDLDVLSASAFDDTLAWYENTDGLGSFGPPQIITTESLVARAILAADLDGDGDLDVVGAAAGGDNISWYGNTDGSGSFGPPTLITDDVDGPWSIVAVDLDADGDLDLVSASLNDSLLAWYPNLNNGLFGDQQIISTQADFPLGVTVGDVDGDGDLDVLSASSGDDKIAWYERTGSGSFGAQQVISASASDAWVVLAVDVDGDGDLDAVSASATDNKIAWYEKINGLDSFGPQQVISTDGQLPRSIVASDLDADGDLDILSASEGDNEISWYANLDGLGSFGSQQIIAADAFEARSVATGDLDGDGDLDVLSASQENDRIVWYENLADDCNGNTVPDTCESDCDADGLADACQLASGQATDCNGNDVLDACDIATATSLDCTGDGVPDECEADCNGNQAADSCDIDSGSSQDCAGDGVPDECEADCNGNQAADSCDIDLGSSPDCTGNGIPDECEVDCNGNSQADSCELDAESAEDCDSNGVLDECDIAGGSAEDCDSNGVPDACQTRVEFFAHRITTESNFPRGVVTTDVDGDLDTDVLAASFLDDRIALYPNIDGDGTFGEQLLITDQANGAISVFAADLDNDGDPDVLSTSQIDDKLAWYENLDGLGNYGPQRVISTEGDGAVSVVAEDLDGDGDRDVVTASFLDGGVAWHENLDGVGTFGERQNITTTADGVVAVITADLDGDLDPDVLSASINDDRIAWYENLDGAGDFSPPRTITALADSAQSVFAADVDGDGDQDVLYASRNDDTIAWHENLGGQATFGPRRTISTTANGATDVYAADLDGDGDQDVLSASFFDDAVGWHENLDGLGNFGPRVTISTTGSGTFTVAAADLDGDADIDVIGVSQNDDEIFWYENESDDCNGNLTPDVCDLLLNDCTGNGIPDDCEADCNGNDEADSCDIQSGTSDDCNSDGQPDECEPDCNGNGQADVCDITDEVSDDCNGNFTPDECEPDCNGDGIPDACDPDCNANGIPDGCEGDCNANDIPDECDLTVGTSIDCNGNDLPDECDSSCTQDCDADEDLCLDDLDTDPGNNHVCGDSDLDKCDDCDPGRFDPSSDGVDGDEDGLCILGDCDDDDPTIWFWPKPVTTLALSGNVGTTLLTWEEPDEAGAFLVLYDTLRSPHRDNFGAPATCLEFDQDDRLAGDFEIPPEGGAFYYLIRIQNGCSGAFGVMGPDSDGTPRVGRFCP